MSMRIRGRGGMDSPGRIVATLLAAIESITGVSCDVYTDAILAGPDAGNTMPGLSTILCVHCEQHHTARFLCDPAKALLDALAARAAERNMPTLTFLDEPLTGNPFRFGTGPGDRLLSQLVVQAATIPIGDSGITKPAIILTGQDHTGAPLPQWLYAGNPADLNRSAKLVADMCALAIQGAHGGGKGRRR